MGVSNHKTGVPFIAYFLGAIVAGLVVFILVRSVIEDVIIINSFALLSGALLIGLAYLLMKKTASNKLESKASESSDILNHNLDLE